MEKIDTKDRYFSAQLEKLITPVRTVSRDIQQRVANILNSVFEEGDSALLKLTKQLDNNLLASAKQLRIGDQRIEESIQRVSQELISALQTAIQRINAFHQKQQAEDWSYYDEHGVLLGQRTTPIDSVGVYVPGGKACYPSSILMNVIPAKVAGVNRIALVTPAMNGDLNPVILATAGLLGVKEIYQIGGAQAIASLAYGTQSIAKVDKIVGPGNVYVAEAKRQVFGTVGIDMIAGPSEVVIVADEHANPEHLMADLFAQAEHDELAKAILISDSEHVLEQTAERIAEQMTRMSRQAIIQPAIKNNGALIKTESVGQSIEIANQLAPEHVQLSINDAEQHLNKITAAGAIFLGHQTPVAFGDYLAGSNHVLPTARSARFSSPLGVYDFHKKSSFVKASAMACQNLYPLVSRLARAEGFSAHALSCELRSSKKSKQNGRQHDFPK